MSVKPKSHVQNYSDGSLIFQEGDPGDCAYLIESGQVAIEKSVQGQPVVMATFGKGEIFGEMAILDGLNRSASARSLGDCSLLVIKRQQLFDQLQNTNPITHLLIKILLKRIRNTTEKLGSSHPSSLRIPNDPLEQIVESSDEPALDRIRLGSELQHALDTSEFRLFYQPIVAAADRSVVGFESLIRWESPDRGLVPPNDFIGLMEESSLIIPVGSWIQRRAFEDLQRIKSHFRKNFFMSLNISVRQLENANFVEELERNRKDFGLEPHEIKLEVTERILMDGQSGLELLSDAKKKGFLISIDDFGTGYSNFQFLTKFGFDSLKIDRSLLRAAMVDSKMASVLKGISTIAHDLEMDLITEGIETENEFALTQRLRMDMGQGYLFSKPLALQDLLK